MEGKGKEIAGEEFEDAAMDSEVHASYNETGKFNEEEGEDEVEDEYEYEDEDEEDGQVDGELPFYFVDDDGVGDTSGSVRKTQSYEALAERKRKALLNPCSDSSAKKARRDDVPTEVMDEIMDAMMGYGFRRKSRKAKRRGKRGGSKGNVSPEIAQMMGEATLHYALGRYKEAIAVLCEVIRQAPQLSDSYHTLGLVHTALGDTKKGMQFYLIAAFTSSRNSALWRSLFTWYIEQGNTSQASYCLDRAIKADPEDMSLKHRRALLFIELGDNHKAAEAYEKMLELSPNNVDAMTNAAKLYLKCGQNQQAVDILENYLKDHPSDADFSVICLLAAVFMEINSHSSALKLFEEAQLVYYSGKELPLTVRVKAGLCHLHLGDVEKAETCFSVLQPDNLSDYTSLVTEVGDTLMRFEHFKLALKYYHLLEKNAVVGASELGHIHLHVAQCFVALKEREKAVNYYEKALCTLEDNVDARLCLATLLREDAKEAEAITLLSPPPDKAASGATDTDEYRKWWNDGRIKLMLCEIFRAKEMMAEFVDAILPSVRESLYCESLRQKNRGRKTVPTSELLQRVRKLDDQLTDDIFGAIRTILPPNDRVRAARARKKLQIKAALREEKKAMAKAAGVDVNSDFSDDDLTDREVRVAPLPNILTDEKQYKLIIDLCKVLASLQRYWEALEIINLTQKLTHNTQSPERKEELQSLGAQISYSTSDPENGFDCVRYIVQQHPYSISAWNCYYKVVSRLSKGHSKHAKFLRRMRHKYSDCVPPAIICGHQFTVLSHHQDAAREYLEAYKLSPENPLVNLCVGTALINVALGFRLQNKHQCVAQGLAFLYNNLRLSKNSQEALYNIARACHHVGLVTLAVSYYEKVLAIREKDYPIPRLPNEKLEPIGNQKSGYCDLRREAAYNLHLIYMKSGAVDLSVQILKDHCLNGLDRMHPRPFSATGPS